MTWCSPEITKGFQSAHVQQQRVSDGFFHTCHVLGYPVRILVDYWLLGNFAVIAMRETGAAQCERSNDSGQHGG